MTIFLFPVVAVAAAALLLLAVPEPATRPGWRLVWSDEFDQPGAAAPDPARWVYETGYVRNKEDQYYTDDRRENVRIENGHLVIEARKETIDVPGQPGQKTAYTAGSVETRGRAAWKYGRIEVRAKIPTGRGLWPAIWMLGEDVGFGGWPMCGEIDVMENVGFNPDVIHGTVHTGTYNGSKRTEKGGTITIPRPYDDFHVYAVEWDADKIDFLLDGQRYFTFANDGKGDVATWPYNQPFYLKLNVAVGGGWGGQRGIDDAVFPQRMLVDYVRVYQRDGE